MHATRAESFVFCFITKNKAIRKFRITVLPVVLYEYETWSVTRREENRLRVLEMSVLRKIFWPFKEESVKRRNELD
jgi:hypothetical protein